MTTTAAPTPPSPPPTFVAPPPRPRRSGVAIWLGGAVAVLGALLVLAGGAVLAIFGTDGELHTSRHDLATPTSALVSEPASIDGTDDVGIGRARVRLSAAAAGGEPVFVGVARAGDVDRYLDGAATDEVTDIDFDPFTTERDRHPGAAIPAAPGAQDFWVERSSSADVARIDWKVRDGDYRLVVMNADGSRGVDTRTSIGVKIPWLPGVGFGALVLGLVVAAGGITAVALGARPRA